ncbi:hypothetical protein EJ05DRAFT_479076 [Pseudovirgaria hyperparasitica]|uniref:Uncharacterized protein n=1 Tax=Pseudovirgaria hyperparasitica TaxID=470096 RepID=A0A6A6VYJ4_9PEZI|nr:uncharacterized protein EJ05DRAFT_479076 [Pseudovirgaria hyperparasitica]KAF2755285.1 hypothetical protein EJ05DRAFT_479076 [Pseudovirgaria hyperparasitica]
MTFFSFFFSSCSSFFYTYILAYTKLHSTPLHSIDDDFRLPHLVETRRTYSEEFECTYYCSGYYMYITNNAPGDEDESAQQPR